jgi:hypothetical protein
VNHISKCQTKVRLGNNPTEHVPSSSKASVPTPGAVTSTSAKAIAISTQPSDSKIIIRTQAVKEFEEVVKTFSHAAVALPVNPHNRTKKFEDEIITTCTRIRKLEQGSVLRTQNGYSVTILPSSECSRKCAAVWTHKN